MTECKSISSSSVRVRVCAFWRRGCRRSVARNQVEASPRVVSVDSVGVSCRQAGDTKMSLQCFHCALAAESGRGMGVRGDESLRGPSPR